MRRQIEQQILQLTGLSLGGIDYTQPTGDPGLFHPDAVCWRIHSDFPAMLCGGISALMLQMLHPLALAGVWDHSNFRTDMLGRLRRTSQFVAATTFGPTAEAERLITKVRSIHAQVTGTSPDGQAYSAEDPHLLRWVHVCEVYSFMQAYLRYRNPGLSRELQETYYREVALVAERLGAEDIPITINAIEDYFERMRAELRFDQRTEMVMQALFHAPTPSLLTRPIGRTITLAGFDLLPDWAIHLNPNPVPKLQRRAARQALQGLAPAMRWSLRNGVSTLACRRMGLEPFWARSRWP